MSYDPHSNEWLLNRFEIYKDLREQDTAYWCEKYGVHVITRYDDVFFALNNPKIFSSAGGNLLIENGERLGRTLGASDNPVHNEYKDIVIKAYSKNNLERISKSFAERATKLLENKTEINISDVTEELGAWLTIELLNSPLDKEEALQLALYTHRHHPLVAIENVDPEAGHKYLKINNHIRMKIPSGPGVYNEYVNNNPKGLDRPALMVGSMATGPGSTAAALQFLTLDLFYENQLDTVLKNKSLIPKAVNESLRFRAGVGRFTRTVTKDITMHGVNLKPGDRVAISLESANRDPARWYNPDEFIINRTDKTKNLAWGHGVHACIALAISKEMLRLYLKILLDQVGKYEILTKPEDLKYVLMFGGNISIMSNIMLRKL
jgi:cytochrome P450